MFFGGKHKMKNRIFGNVFGSCLIGPYGVMSCRKCEFEVRTGRLFVAVIEFVPRVCVICHAFYVRGAVIAWLGLSRCNLWGLHEGSKRSRCNLPIQTLEDEPLLAKSWNLAG